MNASDREYWELVGEYRAPYVASAIVIAVMTKADGKAFLEPITASDAANRFSEIFGEDMSSLMIEPALQLLCEWGLADRVEDQFVKTRYVLHWDRIDLYYDQNWNDKSGLIYKIRAAEPHFLREALVRTEDEAAIKFVDGERPGALQRHSQSQVEIVEAEHLTFEPEIEKFESSESSPVRQIDWTKWGTILTGVGLVVALIALVV